MANFKVGDQVRLKSGGAKMTVTLLKKTIPIKKGDVAQLTGKVTCSWHVNEVPYSEIYHEDALELDDK